MQALSVDLLEMVYGFVGCLRGKVVDDRLAFIIVCIQHCVSAERSAGQRRLRRANGPSMVHQCPCGGIVSLFGSFDGAWAWNMSEAVRPARHDAPRPPGTLKPAGSGADSEPPSATG